MGGWTNKATGSYSAVLGGQNNVATGAYSVALGRRAKVLSKGSFVFSDGTDADFASGVDNEFIVGAIGGIGFYTSKPFYGTGCYISPGGGTWNCTSDRATKSDVAGIDATDVLDRLATVPISTWRFSGEPDHIRHIGPMAQDFRAAFGLGHDEKSIATVDAQGIALAAIQGLHKLILARDEQIGRLEAKLAELSRVVRAAPAATVKSSARSTREPKPTRAAR